MGRPPVGKAAMSGAERTRRYRDRLRHNKPVTKPARPDHAALVRELAQVKAELAQAKPLFEAELAQAKAQAMALVETELAQAKARIEELRQVTAGADMAALKAENTELRKQLAQAKARISDMGMEMAAQTQAFRDEVKRRAAKAKPKAEKPSLPPDEERDRQIKSLKTRVRNLTAELHHEREHAEKAQSQTGAMDFRTTSAIAKCLFPDQRHNATEADKDKACKLFTAWKADKDKARRAARS